MRWSFNEKKSANICTEEILFQNLSVMSQSTSSSSYNLGFEVLGPWILNLLKCFWKVLMRFKYSQKWKRTIKIMKKYLLLKTNQPNS